MAPKSEHWIQTFTGKFFYPLEPEESDYCIEDIAHALSNICRFTGQCDRFYSVAQHSLIVSELVPPELMVQGLLHDASEAYITDIARPLKHLPAFDGYREIERRTQAAVFKALGVEDKGHLAIKTADGLLLRNEAKCLKLLTPEWWHHRLPDLGIDIKPMSPTEAEAAFLKKWREPRPNEGPQHYTMRRFYEETREKGA
ncbi:Uncharacterised protein [uncultured archaeon]|nr:Uncharacterised protein [uncultured archaeon]